MHTSDIEACQQSNGCSRIVFGPLVVMQEASASAAPPLLRVGACNVLSATSEGRLQVAEELRYWGGDVAVATEKFQNNKLNRSSLLSVFMVCVRVQCGTYRATQWYAAASTYPISPCSNYDAAPIYVACPGSTYAAAPTYATSPCSTYVAAPTYAASLCQRDIAFMPQKG